MFIRSERLFLRPGWAEDREELRSRINDETVLGHTLFNAPAGQFPVPPAYLNGHERRLPNFLITLPGADGTRLIGCVGLRAGDQGAELVCGIAADHCNQGYATEAGRAVLRLARTLGHTRILAVPRVVDPALDRVLAKLGFRATGPLRRDCDLGEPDGGHGPFRRFDMQVERCAA